MPANAEHEAIKPFQPPNANVKVWRYMDLPKLIDLLETRSLHFSRADTLGDPFEGSWTQGDAEYRDQIYQSLAAETGKSWPHGSGGQYLGGLTQHLRRVTYINCWHAGETESAAMWRLYGTAAGSVAIQTTYKKLAVALPDKLYIGMVRYISYDFGNWINQRFAMSPFMRKRNEFEHEREVRALLMKSTAEAGNQLGFAVDIDIENTIETIRVHPAAPAWIRESITKLLGRYGWRMKVRSSEIDVEPLYGLETQ